MDWKSIAGVVAPIAPKLGAVLGAAIGGPVGSTIGGLAGRAIAGALGVDATPDAVGRALATDPEAVRKLQILEETEGERIRAEAAVAIERLKAEAAQAESIGTTQRAEIASGVSWWHWRHLVGYVTMLYGLVFLGGSAKIMFVGGDVGALTALVTASTPIFLAICALNGYIASDSTKLKTTAITGTVPEGALSTLVNAMTGKR